MLVYNVFVKAQKESVINVALKRQKVYFRIFYIRSNKRKFLFTFNFAFLMPYLKRGEILIKFLRYPLHNLYKKHKTLFTLKK